jgi:hypothetical protein
MYACADRVSLLSSWLTGWLPANGEGMGKNVNVSFLGVNEDYYVAAATSIALKICLLY